MYQVSLPTYITLDNSGFIMQGTPSASQAFSSLPGVAWRNPAGSVYIADSCLTKSPLTYPSESYGNYGTSGILPPSDNGYLAESAVSRRFADRHLGTNCLFVDGHVESFPTAVLDSMVSGEANCIWDVE